MRDPGARLTQTALEAPAFLGMRPGPRAHVRDEYERLKDLRFDRMPILGIDE